MSKSRQIIPANTHKWTHLKAVALGATVVLQWIPCGVAAEPSSPPGAVSSDVAAANAAADRWKRIKSQQQAAAAARSRADGFARPAPIRAVSETTPANPRAASTNPEFRPFPDDEESAFKADESATVIPAVSAGDEPQFIDPDNVPGLTPKKTEFDQALEEPAPGAPAAKKPPYEETNETKSPLDPDPSIRRITPGSPNGPPRKTTQVRRIGDIAPLNDSHRDTDIKEYAAEKAREFNVKFGAEAYTPRNFPDTMLPWAAPMSKYYPLYFQDPALERYGHSHHPLIQPIISSARVSGQLVMMPYQMTIVPPWELQSPLGWYRPGDVVPKLKYPFPWNTTAAAVEAAAVTGFIYLIP